MSPCAVSCSPDVGCPDGLFCGSEARCVYEETTVCSALPSIALTIEISGQGRVVDNLNGIDCSESCVIDLPLGTAVNLVPLPGEDWKFKHWHKGACDKMDLECSLVLDDSVTEKAEFEDKD